MTEWSVVISDLCNTGGHYQCPHDLKCQCTCHPIHIAPEEPGYKNYKFTDKRDLAKDPVQPD